MSSRTIVWNLNCDNRAVRSQPLFFQSRTLQVRGFALVMLKAQAQAREVMDDGLASVEPRFVYVIMNKHFVCRLDEDTGELVEQEDVEGKYYYGMWRDV